jgi:hypothetical protein
LRVFRSEVGVRNVVRDEPPENWSGWMQYRLRYPDWGARKLQVVLAQEGAILTRSTIHRILLRHGMVREEDRRSEAKLRFERKYPNELWQMDLRDRRAGLDR